jgi:hypothetical protein
MTNKIILFIAGIVIGLLIATYSINHFSFDSNFQHTTDSLNNVISNLKQDIVKEDSIICVLNSKDSVLKNKVNVLAHERDQAVASAVAKANNPSLNNNDSLIKFYVNRYPTNNKIDLKLPKITLLNAAKDLILGDGIKQELTLADSTIGLLNERIDTKDSLIISYITKDTLYQNIIKTQDVKYVTLETETQKIIKDNSKLKTKVIMWKAATGLTIIGTLLILFW